MPALIQPADVPDDAEGRIAYVTVELPADADPAPDPEGPSQTGDLRMAPAAEGRAGWLAVAVLGLLLVAVFVVGMAVTR